MAGLGYGEGMGMVRGWVWLKVDEMKEQEDEDMKSRWDLGCCIK